MGLVITVRFGGDKRFTLNQSHPQLQGLRMNSDKFMQGQFTEESQSGDDKQNPRNLRNAP